MTGRLVPLPDNALRIWVVIAILFGVAMFAVDQSFLANVAFLVAGALIATVTQLISESKRRQEQAVDVAGALYQELANRIARCVFDFEAPWERWIDRANCRENEVDVLRLRKFMPVPPVIYPALAEKIGLLDGSAAQATIRFYSALEICRRDMAEVAAHCASKQVGSVPPDQVAILAERLRRTLGPGLDALQALSGMVVNSDTIDAEAIRDADGMFKHTRAHLTLKQRLAHYAST